jgi:hypothetical protein
MAPHSSDIQSTVQVHVILIFISLLSNGAVHAVTLQSGDKDLGLEGQGHSIVTLDRSLQVFAPTPSESAAREYHYRPEAARSPARNSSDSDNATTLVRGTLSKGWQASALFAAPPEFSPSFHQRKEQQDGVAKAPMMWLAKKANADSAEARLDQEANANTKLKPEMSHNRLKSEVNTKLQPEMSHSRLKSEATSASKTKTRSNNQASTILLWGCIVGILTIVGVAVTYLCMHYRSPPGARNKEYGASSEHLTNQSKSSHRSSRSSGKSSQASDRLSSLDSEAITSSNEGSQKDALLPGLPLCHLLVVPDGTRLACVVQNDVRRRKQELSFDICAVPARGGAPLFRMRVSELGQENPGIFVETLGGREQLAFLSTQDLWLGSSRPALSISRPWGLPYGMVQKGDNGEYLVMRGTTTLLVLTGDFQSHTMQVLNATGQVVATTLQTSPEEYQAHMLSRTDAGLVILSLLAIDKFESTGSPDTSFSGTGIGGPGTSGRLSPA